MEREVAAVTCDGRLFHRLVSATGNVLGITAKPEQQWFTMRSGLLTSISSSQRSAISGSPLLERTLSPAVCRYIDRPTCDPASRTMAFTPQRLTIFSSHYYRILIAASLLTPEDRRDGRLSWSEHRESSVD